MIVYAVNNHSGGGKVILDRVLLGQEFGPVFFAFVDRRYQALDLPSSCVLYFVEPTLFSRLLAEFKLRRLSQKNPDLEVLSLTNMPPIFRLQSKTSLYFQNALLLPGKLKLCKSWKHWLRTAAEYAILRIFNRNLDQIYVQTNWVKNELSSIFKKPILLKPIYPELAPTQVGNSSDHQSRNFKFDYLAVSGAVEYKNLSFLLNAWAQLPDFKKIKLLLVVDDLQDKHKKLLNQLKQNGYQIQVERQVSRDRMANLYQHSRCLLMCSSIESFCLPLYEAQKFNLNVVAPDLPYVRDAKMQNLMTYRDLDVESFKSALQRQNRIIMGQPEF